MKWIFWGPFWSYQLNSTTNLAHFLSKWLDWQCCLDGSSKTAPRIFIFSIVLGAGYSFYVKSIATFLGYNNSVLVEVFGPNEFFVLSLKLRENTFWDYPTLIVEASGFGQNWKNGSVDNEGYFVLINQISGQALTASTNDTLKTEKSMTYTYLISWNHLLFPPELLGQEFLMPFAKFWIKNSYNAKLF